MHFNADKIGLAPIAKLAFLLGSYNVAYKVCFQKLKRVYNVYYSTGLKIAGLHEPYLEQTRFRGLRQWLDYTELSAYYKLQNIENKYINR